MGSSRWTVHGLSARHRPGALCQGAGPVAFLRWGLSTLGALSKCVAWRRGVLVEVTRAEKSEPGVRRWPRQRAGRGQHRDSQPALHEPDRLAPRWRERPSTSSATETSGHGDEVPLAVESPAAITCVGCRRHADQRRGLPAAGRAHRPHGCMRRTSAGCRSRSGAGPVERPIGLIRMPAHACSCRSSQVRGSSTDAAS